MPGRKKVAIVLDRSFGGKLTELARSQPVWLWDSMANRAAAQNVWDAGVPSDHVTVFTAANSGSAEEAFLYILDTVDQHHPAWSQLLVIGAEFTASIKTELAEYGGGFGQSIPHGFTFERPI